jgi:putative methyltransferase (TIGR04325 family)
MTSRPGNARRWRAVVRDLMPPVVIRGLRRVRHRARFGVGTERRRIEGSWPEAGEGWNHESVAQAYARNWDSFRRALTPPGPLGIVYEVPPGAQVIRDNPAAHNDVMTFAYVLGRAALRRGGSVSLLDWGGATGHFALLAEALYPDLNVEYHCREVPTVCATGRTLLPTGVFHDDDRCLERQYDLVLASGSLQYSERWQQTLENLAGSTAGSLFVTNLACTTAASFVALERPAEAGYQTSFPGWVLNDGAFLAVAADAGLVLARSFFIEGDPTIFGSCSPTFWGSFLFDPS